MILEGVQAQLADILHVFSQALLAPVIVLLLAFVGYALFCIGSIVAEGVNERKNFKVETPKFLQSLMDASEADLPHVIKQSGLLNRQKAALLTVYDYRGLPGDALIALVRRLMAEEEGHYKHIVDRNNTAAKISPMVGLMGTLIPLGPGVAALGTGDTVALSSSLLIAFDTTVAGLIVAAVCLAIGKIRGNWYEDYLAALDSAMATLLEKFDKMREAGQLEDGARPTDFAERFKQGLAKDAAPKKESEPEQKPEREPKPESAVEALRPESASHSAAQAAQPAAPAHAATASNAGISANAGTAGAAGSTAPAAPATPWREADHV